MTDDPNGLQIVTYPDPVLRQAAERIERVVEKVRAVAERMIELMHEACGVGLAAPQVGLSWRMFVANPSGDKGDDRVYINPELSRPTRHTDRLEEGCLSIPDVRAPIMRPLGIAIDAWNERGEPIHDESDGLVARIWQHETDHLDGVLILDRMTPADKRVNRRAIEALEAADAARR
jgi:peptide deformylase